MKMVKPINCYSEECTCMCVVNKIVFHSCVLVFRIGERSPEEVIVKSSDVTKYCTDW